MEATVGIVSIRHGVVRAEREAGVAAEGVGCAFDLHAVLPKADPESPQTLRRMVQVLQ